jgi:hypothetical protein
MKWKVFSVVAVLLSLGFVGSSLGRSLAESKELKLASDGKALYTIVTDSNPSEVKKYAAEQLAQYLQKITGAKFAISSKKDGPSIIVSGIASLDSAAQKSMDGKLNGDGYVIMVQARDIYLAGSDPANVLYSVYGFLEKLGCRWLSPGFDFYDGQYEYVPTVKNLTYQQSGDIFQSPSMKYRKLYIEEGRSHNVENIKQMIDWMPKARFNVIVCPIDYQAKGRVKWDKWRDALVPELKKRGILIEVGGHGYQNFFNAEMENGELFKKHPDWFGMNSEGNRTENHNRVMCSSKREPVEYLKRNVLAYLNDHPEIDIFDFWPPDGVRWCRCPECQKLGSPSDVHALIVNDVADFLRSKKINARIECIAYTSYEQPPEKVTIDSSAMIDVCPFKQDFTRYMYDPSSKQNASFLRNVHSWLRSFDGDMCVYSYYRKYVWRCLPNMIPDYMQKELQYYKNVGIVGISTYAEPGDWFTYELNHYVLSKLAWNVDVDVDAVISDFCRIRYGDNSELAVDIFAFFQDTVRFYCNIAQSPDREVQEYSKVLTEVDNWLAKINKAKSNVKAQYLRNNLNRLELMFQYMKKDVQLQRHRISGLSKTERHKMVDEMMDFLDANVDKGVFLKTDHKRFEYPRMYRAYSASEK